MQKLKVMIVEDESLERMLLKRFLEAEADGYEVVMEAAFALEVLEYLDEHAVDIVITDINMPVMDGLDMAQHILKMDPGVQVIVITGYNDFDHAQRAIKIGIVDYLVKPVEAKEFSLILSNVREKILLRRGGGIAATEIERQIAQDMPILRDRFLYELVTKPLDPAAYREKLSYYRLEIAGDRFQVGVVVLDPDGMNTERQLFASYMIRNMARETLKSAYAFPVDSNQLVLLSSDVEEADFDALKRALDGALDAPVAIGVGSMEEGAEGIRRSYAEAVRAVNCRSFLSTQQVLYYQDLGVVEDRPNWTEHAQTAMAELEQMGFYLRGGMNAGARAWVERHFADGAESLESARHRAVVVITGLHAMRVEPFMDLKGRIAQTLDMTSVAKIRDLLLMWMGEATSALNDIRTNAVSKQIMGVIAFVNEHLSEPSLSLHETSKRFFFNASYLSRIFKQNTGMSFREYINKQRIEQARKYLDEPDAKAYEVGARVGIDDPNYFSTLFKKYSGMTIKQYRASSDTGHKGQKSVK
jgi:two-component system response regulator YesN